MERINNLQFLIGAFLAFIGSIVLGVHYFGGDDSIQNIPVNLLGGGVLALVGVAMMLGGFLLNAPRTPSSTSGDA